MALNGTEIVQEIFRKFYLFLTRTGMMIKADMKYVNRAIENVTAWVEDAGPSNASRSTKST